MKYVLTIESEKPEDIARILIAVAPTGVAVETKKVSTEAASSTPAEPTAETKASPGRGRPPGSKNAPKPSAPATQEAEDAPGDEEDGFGEDDFNAMFDANPPAEAKEYTAKDVQDKLIEVGRKKGKLAMMEVLQKVGCKTPADAKPAQFAEIVAQADKKLAD